MTEHESGGTGVYYNLGRLLAGDKTIRIESFLPPGLNGLFALTGSEVQLRAAEDGYVDFTVAQDLGLSPEGPETLNRAQRRVFENQSRKLREYVLAARENRIRLRRL